jgi:hypothetical protein
MLPLSDWSGSLYLLALAAFTFSAAVRPTASSSTGWTWLISVSSPDEKVESFILCTTLAATTCASMGCTYLISSLAEEMT